MVALSIKTNFPAVQEKLAELGKQGRYACAVALTRTAQDVKRDLVKEMAKVFDRPTRFTLNSLYLKPATKADLTARVWLKDEYGTQPNYLLPQIEGGNRVQKRFEVLLRQRGLLADSERTVPGAGAKLDGNGNMSRGQIVQIISQLGAFNLAGASQNATGSKRSKAKRAKGSYFYARRGEARTGRGSWKQGLKVQHLPTGIYLKTAEGIKPVLIFVHGAKYRIRLHFVPVALGTIERAFPGHFAREYAKALRTARWGELSGRVPALA
jgi:hypothetical protein